MKLFTNSLLALASAGAVNAWTLYCGDSCTNGTAIVSGVDDYKGATCTDLNSTSYDHCYFESEEPWYHAVVFELGGCWVGGDTPATVVETGVCVSAGPYLSYEVVVNL
ncbi:hypothetical protein VMCG_08119 [Cytospora schulzeri]|uniref:Uncharacterized protein n=1 Tax=Cytospora schulzeri TaxID=448051 RepID=A0A423VRB7_9PEZI|nr:hypothetical protein VMCG_08119 [Valsa malicola]